MGYQERALRKELKLLDLKERVRQKKNQIEIKRKNEAELWETQAEKQFKKNASIKDILYLQKMKLAPPPIAMGLMVKKSITNKNFRAMLKEELLGSI